MIVEMEPALRLWILVVIIALYVLYIYVSKRGRLFEGFVVTSQIDALIASYEVSTPIYEQLIAKFDRIVPRPVDIQVSGTKGTGEALEIEQTNIANLQKYSKIRDLALGNDISGENPVMSGEVAGIVGEVASKRGEMAIIKEDMFKLLVVTPGYAVYDTVEYKLLKSMLLNGGNWVNTWRDNTLDSKWKYTVDQTNVGFDIQFRYDQYIIESGMAFNIYNKWYSVIKAPLNIKWVQLFSPTTNVNTAVNPTAIIKFLNACRYFTPLNGENGMTGVDDMLNIGNMNSPFKYANLYHSGCVMWILSNGTLNLSNNDQNVIYSIILAPYLKLYENYRTALSYRMQNNEADWINKMGAQYESRVPYKDKLMDTIEGLRTYIIPEQRAITNRILSTFTKTISAYQNTYLPSQIDRAVSVSGYDTPGNSKSKKIFIHILVNGGDPKIPLSSIDIFKIEEDYNYINGIYTKWVQYMTDPANREYIPSNRLNVAFGDIVSNSMKSLRASSASILPSFPTTLGASTTATNSRVTACRELNDLHKQYVDMLALVRKQMDDLSGTEVLGGNLKAENMKFQYLYEDKCTDRMHEKGIWRQSDEDESNSCKGLASQDELLHNTIVPGYDMTNTTLFKQAALLEDHLYTINTVISLTACDISGEFAIDAEVDIGTINVEEIKEKLNELSPYFISSGTLDFVTKYLVGNGILDTALYTSTEILTIVKKNLETGIRPLANDQFGIK